jgi:filamin
MDRAFKDGVDLFKIPQLLDAEDVVSNPDELSIMTYVAYYRAYMNMNTAFAPNCTAEGPGLTHAVAGEVGRFTVTCRSAENEEATRGGARVNCKLMDNKGNPVCSVLVKDLGTGKYDCEYNSPVDGDMELHVMIKTDHIKDSPFHPKIEPGEPSPKFCEASGPGIHGATAGEQTHFTITAKDRNGKLIPKGGWNFTSSFKGPKGDIPVQVVDNGNGTYNCTYTPKAAGDSELQVNVSTKANGSGPIKDAPFRFKTKPGKADFSNWDMDVDVEADGLRHVTAGVPDKFVIHSKDANGNRCDTGGVKVTGKGSGTDDIPIHVVDNGDGSYTVDYTCFKAGPYKVELSGNGNKIGGVHNPLSVLCSPAAADASQSIAFGPGIEKAVVGADNHFTVQSRDAFGNNLKKGGAKISGALVAPDGTKAPVVGKDNGDGTYHCTYPSLTKNGVSQLTPTLNGSPVKDAPFRLNVESDATDPSKTKVRPTPTGLEVELCDRHGNKREADKRDNVGCKTKKKSEDKVKAVRNPDGTFTVKWPPSFNGDYEAMVTVNGHQAPGGPWNAKLEQPPLSAQHAQAVQKAYPSVAKTLNRLLLAATPAERDRIVAAFGGAQGGQDSSSSSESD